MTIFGWDESHFDAPSIGTALAEGIKFITHKAGGDATDTELPAWWSGVKGLDPTRVLLGAYWVLYPGNPVGRADAFITRLDAACPGWRDRPFLLQADCEEWNGNPATVPNRTEVGAFCDRLVAKMPKLRPVVYAPKWVYGDRLTGLGYPLWASAYVTGVGGFKGLYPGDSNSRWGKYSGQTPAILQYSSSATIGGQTTCDANAYRGTLADLIALAAPGWETDMPLTPADAQLVVKTLLDTELPFPYDAKNPTRTYRDIVRYTPSKDVIDAQLRPDFAGILEAVAAQPTVDVAALGAAVTAGVLAALTPEVLATLPADFAENVATAVLDGLSRRLAA
jgi:GH25 family lysozyme M1 (1,4-beta-N-acetylmuramidase)